jgi:hypothetical protein
MHLSAGNIEDVPPRPFERTMRLVPHVSNEVAMTLTPAQALPILLSLLSSGERDHAIAYINEQPVAAGQVIAVGPERLAAPFAAIAAFIDEEPSANWSHACRYLLISVDNDEVRAIPGRFPPFSKADPGHWRLAYRAPGVPDSFVLVPDRFDHEP